MCLGLYLTCGLVGTLLQLPTNLQILLIPIKSILELVTSGKNITNVGPLLRGYDKSFTR